MEDKLQQLTRKLYDEGLEKGRAEAERLVNEAKAEAAKIVAEARAEAESIVKKAEARAADAEKNAMTEIALAGKQAVAKIKSEIASMIVAESVAPAVKSAAMDPAFIEEMLLAVAKELERSRFAEGRVAGHAARGGAGETRRRIRGVGPQAARRRYRGRLLEGGPHGLQGGRPGAATTSRSPMPISMRCWASICAVRFPNCFTRLRPCSGPNITVWSPD